MAFTTPVYLRSTDGDNTDNGTTWALARATLESASLIAVADVATGVVYVSHVHAENTTPSADVALNFPTTDQHIPSQILCVNDGAQPPTALAATATFTWNGDFNVIWDMSNEYVYGCTFIWGVGSSASPYMAVGQDPNCTTRWERCSFQNQSTTGGRLRNDSAAVQCGIHELRDCTFKWGAAGSCIEINGAGARWILRGGSLLSGGTSPTNFIRVVKPGGSFLIEGFDLSNADAGMNIALGSVNFGFGVIRNCKLPASWSGGLVNSTPPVSGSRYEMYNCDSGATNYRLWIETYWGTIRDETTLIRTSGASDGTTGLAWKLVTNTNSKWQQPLITPDIVAWNDTAGASLTVTVEILHDSATNLKDSEVWVEAQELGASGSPLGTFINDGVDIMSTGSDQATSAATWTTTGMSNPNTQKLSVTFTPQMKGPIYCRVMLAKASKTIYVCPKVAIT